MRVQASTDGSLLLWPRVSHATRVLTFASVLIALVGGCGEASSETKAVQEPAAEPSAQEQGAGQAPEAEKAPEEKPGKEALGNNFALRMHAEAAYEAGKLAQFSVSLVPAEGWKVNEEYPMTVEVDSPEALGVMTSKMGKGDAAAFDTHQARFDIPFTPAAAGEHEVMATVNFAVCTAETCVPDQRKLAVAVQVTE